MKQSRKRGILRELCWTLVIAAVCIGLLLTVVKNRWTFEFQFKELPYLVQGYPQDEVLLIGSSTMEFWTTSEADLGPLRTINVAVEGTKVKDWTEHFSTLVEPFHPSAIVMFLGSADIDGSENSKSGEAVAKELESFFDQIAEALPGTPVYYTSITPTPLRWEIWDEADLCNQLVKEMAEQREELHYIDCNAALLDEDGMPKSDIRRSDGLHFNEEGYKLWKSAIRPVLLEELGGGEIE